MKTNPRNLPYPSAGGEYRTAGESLVRGSSPRAPDAPPADKPEPKTSGKGRKEQ